MKIMMMFTTRDQPVNTGRKIGLWLEEFAVPYFVFRNAGVPEAGAETTGALPGDSRRGYVPRSSRQQNPWPSLDVDLANGKLQIHRYRSYFHM